MKHLNLNKDLVECKCGFLKLKSDVDCNGDCYECEAEEPINFDNGCAFDEIAQDLDSRYEGVVDYDLLEDEEDW